LKKFAYKIVISFFLFDTILYANIISSQPQVIFELQRLESSSENLEIQIDFNKAVLLFKKNDYEGALKLFKKTAEVLEVPSILNIGIIYYKQNRIKEAIENFDKIYSKKINLVHQPYSFILACYYLSAITKEDKYILDLARIFQNSNKLAEYSELITDIKDAILKELANRYLYVKDYENAIAALEAMSYSLDFKKAMVYTKVNNFTKAFTILRKLKEEVKEKDLANKLLWISTYVALKENQLKTAVDNLDLIGAIKDFNLNIQMPFEIFFNKNLHSSKEYLDGVLKFNDDRKLEFIYYFAPFVFSDSREIIYDSVKGFIYEENSSVENLEVMVDYNTKFVKLIKYDPILRVNELKKLLRSDSKAYVYYNLGLAFAQIGDFENAYTNFEKAYKLSPGNKLYTSIYFITSNYLDVILEKKEKEFIDKSLRNSGGLYAYFGKELYKLFVNSSYNVTELPKQYKGTAFYKAIDFLKDMYDNKPLNNHILLEEYEKDNLVYLLRLVQRQKGEDDYRYFARLQDNIPLTYNNSFIDSSLITSKYYIDILRALGVFAKADFNIQGNNNPIYLLTKAYSDLYLGRPQSTIDNLKKLKDEFSYENKFSMYLGVAAFLEAKRPEDASIQIALIKAFYKDKNTDILTAIQLLNNMNINSAKQFLENRYNNPYIDFRPARFDELMLLL